MNLLQTSITNPMLLAHYLFGGLLILMQIPWYHREQNLLQMKNQTNALHGEKWIGGMLYQTSFGTLWVL